MPGGGVESRRYVLKKDNMGYSMHLTMIAKDSSMYIHYKNHQESVICVGGSLELEVGKSSYSAGNFCFNKGLCMIWNEGTLSNHKSC